MVKREKGAIVKKLNKLKMILLVIPIFIIFILLRVYLIKNNLIWHIMYYLSITAFGVYVLWHSIDLVGSFISCSKDYGDDVSEAFIYYLNIQIAFYCTSFVYLTAFNHDNKYKDFGSVDMALHHFTTFLILIFAYMFGYRKVSFVILFAHDISDISLNTTKHLKDEYGQNDNITLWSFGLFVTSFFILRFLWFPWYIFNRCWLNVNDLPTGICFIGLVTLFGLHCYWATKILHKTKKLINAKC